MRRLLFVAVLTLALAPVAAAQPVEPIAYTLRFPAPHTHYVTVDARIDTKSPTVPRGSPLSAGRGARQVARVILVSVPRAGGHRQAGPAAAKDGPKSRAGCASGLGAADSGGGLPRPDDPRRRRRCARTTTGAETRATAQQTVPNSNPASRSTGTRPAVAATA